MQKKLLICSRSTEKYFPSFNTNEKIVFNGFLNEEHLKLLSTRESVIACGGGACIDLAKIVGSQEVICYPTTAAGSSETSHSVYWNNKIKKSIKRKVPSRTIVEKNFLKNLPMTVIKNTFCDAISHCFDSMASKKATKESNKLCQASMEILKSRPSNENLVMAGNLAGKAIEISPTTLLHSLSYPMTGHYGLPHGEALGILLCKLKNYYDFDIEDFYKIDKRLDLEIDYDFVVEEAYKYGKINFLKNTIEKKDLISMLKTRDYR